MGVAKSIEQRLEGLVEGFFAKIFRSGLQPVEVGRRILREMAENRTVSVNRVYAPNDFRVLIGSDDYTRFSQMEAGLQREFSELIIDAAKQNRWNLMGIPRIEFVEVEKLGKGEYRVEASLTADPDADPVRVATREPDDAGGSATRAISTNTADRLGIASSGAELIVLDSTGETKDRIAITQTPITIGRLSTNDVVLSDPNVSRRHAELRRNGDDWVLADLGSTNGTLVNGKLAREHTLEHGDKISFGTSDLVFEIKEKP
jgi:FHA domain-containing protein